MRRKLTLNAILLLGADGGAKLFGFLATIWLARELETDMYGVIVLGLSILSWGMLGADLGLKSLGIRELAKPENDRMFTSGDIVSLKTILSFFALLAASLTVLIAVKDAVTRTVAIFYLLSLIPIYWQLEWYFQGKRKYVPIITVKYLFGILWLIGIILFVNGPEDVTVVPIIYLVAVTVAAVAAVFMKDHDDSFLPPLGFGRKQLERYRNALKHSLPIGMGEIFSQIVYFLPPMAIALFYTNSDTGIFGAAFRVAMVMLILDKIFIALFLSNFSHLWSTDRERFTRLLRKVFRLLLIGGIVLSSLMMLLSGEIISFIYPQSYSVATTPLQILSWLFMVTLLSSFFAYTLIASGIERAYFHSSLISGLVTTVLILTLTKVGGINGTAAAILIGESVTASMMYLKFRKHVGEKLL